VKQCLGILKVCLGYTGSVSSVRDERRRAPYIRVYTPIGLSGYAGCASFAWLTGEISQNAVLATLKGVTKRDSCCTDFQLARFSNPRCPRRLCQIFGDSFFSLVVRAVTTSLMARDFWCAIEISLADHSQNLRSLILIEAIVLRSLRRAPPWAVKA
jgi:hypothetical protein